MSLYDLLLALLQNWHTRDAAAERTLAQKALVQQAYHETRQQDGTISIRQVIRRLMEQEIEALKDADPDGAQILQARFIEKRTVRQVANQIRLSQDSVLRRQRQAIEWLAASLDRQEAELAASQALSLESGLPPPTYTRLFGVEPAAQTLTGRLLHSDAPWIAAATGIGGIGKTAVADYVARRVIRRSHYRRLLWIRHQLPTLTGRPADPEAAYQQLMISLSQQPHIDAQGAPAAQRDYQVRQALKTAPHLIVIDNLEEIGAWVTNVQRTPT